MNLKGNTYRNFLSVHRWKILIKTIVVIVCFVFFLSDQVYFTLDCPLWGEYENKTR